MSSLRLNGRALWHAMVVLFQTMSIGSLFLVLSLFFGGPLERLLAGAIIENRLTIVQLDYADGRIRQWVEPEQDEALPGSWSAAIWGPGGEYECSGTGSFTYAKKTRPVLFEPHEWTGSDACRDLIIGREYTGFGIWTWADGEGKPRSIERRFKFTHQEAGNDLSSGQ